jgi:hypothetical protein
MSETANESTEVIKPITLKASRTKNATSTFAIDRLSVEIVQRIFSHCIPEEDPIRIENFIVFVGETGSFGVKRQLSPMSVLGSVSRAWRDVALTTPALWANIALTASSKEQRDGHLARLQKHLERSHRWPFSFHLKGTLVDTEVEFYLPPILELLLSQAYRWKQATFSLPLSPEQLFPLSQISDNGLRCLESLGLHLMGNSRDVSASVLSQWLAALLAARHLRSVELRLTYTSLLKEIDIPIPWGQLTQLRLTGTGLSGATALYILAQAPLLETCVLHIMHVMSFSGPEHLDMVDLPELHSLQVYAECSLAPLLDQLSTPSLDKLSLRTRPNSFQHEADQSSGNESDSDDGDDSDDDFDNGILPPNAFARFLDRAHHLKILELKHIVPSKGKTTAFLGHAPSIESLVIELYRAKEPVLTEAFFLDMNPRHRGDSGGSPLKMPNLRQLSLMLDGPFPGEQMLDMLEARWRAQESGCAQLEHVSLHFLEETGLTCEGWQRLDALMDEGLTMSIETNGPGLDADDGYGSGRCVVEG